MSNRLSLVKEHLNKAKDELVSASILLKIPGDDSFKSTIEEIKNVIGDLAIAVKVIDIHILNK